MKKRIWKWTGLFLAVMLVCMTAGQGKEANASETSGVSGTGTVAEASELTEIPGLTETPGLTEAVDPAEAPGITKMPGMEELSGTGEMLESALELEISGEEEDWSKEYEENTADGQAADSAGSEVTGTGKNPADSGEFGSGEESTGTGENAADGNNSGTGETESGKKASLKLSVRPEETEPKAGSKLLYNVTVENAGDLPLKDLRIRPDFKEEGLTGSWDTSDGLKTEGTEALPDSLNPGEVRLLYLAAALPEGYAGAVNLSLKAAAQFEEASETLTGTVTDSASSAVNVKPLQADFEVTKTADRTAAVPGDKILFQICIRNTGERTLHSVITTEKFKLQGVPVEFMEKEGVVLNNTKTKARIEAIEPGQAMSLNAVVTLPEKLQSQELINEVAVTTAETGERVVVSQAKVQIYGTAEEAEEKPDITAEIVTPPEEKAMSVSGAPKTGDRTPVLLWIFVLAGAAGVLAVCAGYFRSRSHRR